jgi:hypothetical protein
VAHPSPCRQGGARGPQGQGKELTGEQATVQLCVSEHHAVLGAEVQTKTPESGFLPLRKFRCAVEA